MTSPPSRHRLEEIRRTAAYRKVLRIHRFFYAFGAGGAVAIGAVCVIGGGTAPTASTAARLVLLGVAVLVVLVLIACMWRAVRVARSFVQPYLSENGAGRRERRARSHRLNQAILTDVFARGQRD